MSGPIVLALRLSMAFALYGFLGWALYFLWRDIQRQGTLISRREIPGIKLSVEPAQEDARVERYFSKPQIVLGRDPGCDIPLTDDTVSTRHAQLAYHHNQWWLTDLASTNGTFINGAAVNMPTVITSGDEIRCGKVLLSVDLSSDPRAGSSSSAGDTDE